jgi:hypothetical protein
MKTSTKISMIVLAIFLAAQVTNAQQQIPFAGMVSQGFGVAAWNADGTGPEPAFTGHQVPFPGFGNLYYYGASRDYITGNPDHSCFAFLPAITGFPNFTQALTANGYTPGQVKAKFGLVTLGDDEVGLDWFVMDNYHHSSHKYSNFNIFELNGEAMLAIKVDYAVWSVQNGTTTYIIDFGYTPLINISGSSSAGVQAVAQAFLEDLDGKSVRLQCESTYGGLTITGNGRNGGYYNIINGTLTIGNPTIPFKGLFADNQGAAAWDANGTGTEPYGNGHQNYLYYGASVDYDGMNTSPDACLGHFLDGSTGFYNTLLQLQHRGFEMGDLKMKMGLCSLGPDVQGEDWGTINGMHWLNQYNNRFTIEINNEPIMVVLQDTNRFLYYDPANYKWSTETSIGKVYNISDNASADAKFVALSFLRDLGSHYMQSDILELSYAGPLSGNGRNGAFYEIIAAQVKGVHEQATFVPPGEVSGTWSADGSPYYVEGHLTIGNGETLTIEPGVRVSVRGPYHFTVEGCLNAEGTSGNPIMFTASNPNLSWDGLDYNYTPATNDSSLFKHCIFQYSIALGEFPYNCGGAFAIREFNKIRIENCTFRANEAMFISGGVSSGGGAIALWNASPIISHSLFTDNHSRLGGAIFLYDNSNPVISRCLFYNNTSVNDGGAIEIWGSSHPDLINNTFTLNHAGTKGGAVDIYEFSNPVLLNNIFWGNTASQNPQISITSGGCSPVIKYCDVEGGEAGIGPFGVPAGNYKNNLEADPLFIDPLSFIFLLDTLAPSPCIDAGDPLSPPDPDGSTADIGCYCQKFITGINDHNNRDMDAVIYPNPVDHTSRIYFTPEHSGEVMAEVVNVSGQIVQQVTTTGQPHGINSILLETETLDPGIYFYRLRMGDKMVTQKFIKLQ